MSNAGVPPIGMEIGNYRSATAVAKQRIVDVLLNDEAEYDTPSVISFYDKRRNFGSAGNTYAVSNADSTVKQIKRLIGRQFSDVADNEFPFRISEGKEGEIIVHVGEHRFKPVQLLAMLMLNLKRMAEVTLKETITKCVIGVPSYFTDHERMTYLDAAKIAGLEPQQLMDEGSAIALGYAFFKKDVKGTFVFVDLGHSATQVTVVSYTQEEVKILSRAYNKEVGGEDFDKILFNYFAIKFKEITGRNIEDQTLRVRSRMMMACEKLKKVLTSNKEAELNIDCIVDEIDLVESIRRDKFVDLSSDLLEKMGETCKIALMDAGLETKDIDAIELVGSASRIPEVMVTIKKIFDKDPIRTLNASECISRGCALKCSLLLNSHTIKTHKLEDLTPFALRISIGESTRELPRKPLPSEDNKITFTEPKDFKIDVKYDSSSLPPLNTKCFKICSKEEDIISSAAVEIKVNIDLNGMVKIESASLSKDGAQKSFEVSEVSPISMSEEEIKEAKEKEESLAAMDKDTVETSKSKNQLESTIYEYRKKINKQFEEFAVEKDRETITEKLDEMQKWLYQDFENESKQMYDEKIEDVKKLLAPTETRYKDYEANIKVLKDLKELIDVQKEDIFELNAKEKELLKTKCEITLEWINAKEEEHKSVVKHDKVVQFHEEGREKLQELKSTSESLRKDAKNRRNAALEKRKKLANIVSDIRGGLFDIKGGYEDLRKIQHEAEIYIFVSDDATFLERCKDDFLNDLTRVYKDYEEELDKVQDKMSREKIEMEKAQNEIAEKTRNLASMDNQVQKEAKENVRGEDQTSKSNDDSDSVGNNV